MQPKTLIQQRYEIVRPLGKGGMGEVFLVRDRLTPNKPVALKKIASSASEQHLAKFLKFEFTAMSRLNHPHLAKVLDFGIDQELGIFFLTSEFITGIELDSYFAKSPDLKKLTDVIVQVLQALAYIHQQRFLHLDIKPNNILVDPQTHNIKIIDFGTARQFHQIFKIPLAATAHYAAPEIRNAEFADARTDLYSLGITLADLLRAHPLEARKRNLEEFNVLYEVASRLSDPIAYRRFSSANNVIDFLDRHLSLRLEKSQKNLHNPYIQSQNLFGFENELANANKLLSSLQAGKNRAEKPLLLIQGNSGLGKSRFLNELRQAHQLLGVQWIEVDLARSHNIAAHLERVLSVHHSITITTPINSLEIEQHSLKGSEAIWRALSEHSHECPTVLCCENLEHAPQNDIRLIQYLVRALETSPADIRLAILLSSEKPIKHIDLPTICLKPLQSAAEVKSFIESLMPDVSADEGFYKHMLDLTGGNPHSIEVLFNRIASKFSNTEKIHLSHDILKSKDKPDDWIHTHYPGIELLKPNHLKILRILSCARLGLIFDHLISLMGNIGVTEEDLIELFARNLIRKRQMDHRIFVECDSLLLKEQIRSGMDQSTRQETSGLLASFFTAFGPDDQIEYLPYFLEALSLGPRPYEFHHLILKGAQIALRRFDFMHAYQVLTDLLTETLDPVSRAEIHLNLADIQIAEGNFNDAKASLNTALTNTSDRSTVLFRLAELEKETGQLGNLFNLIEIAEKELESQNLHPFTALKAEAQVLQGNYKLALETLAPIFVDATVPAVVLAKAHNIVGLSHLYLQNLDAAIASFDVAAQKAMLLGLTVDHAVALYREGIAYSRRGELEKAGNLLQRSQEIARSLGALKLLCSATINLGVNAELSGKISEAIGFYEEGVRMATKMGDEISRSGAHVNLGSIFTQFGVFDQAEQHALAAISSATTGNQRYFLARGKTILGIVHRAQGRLQPARRCFIEAARTLKSLKQDERYQEVKIELALTYSMLRHFAKAEALARRSQEKTSSPLLQVKAQTVIGSSHHLSNQEKLKINHLALSTLKGLGETIDRDDLLWQTHYRRARLFEAEGNSVEAEIQIQHYRRELQRFLNKIPEDFRLGGERYAQLLKQQLERSTTQLN